MMKVKESKLLTKKNIFKASIAGLAMGIALVASPITAKADLVEEEVTSEGKPSYEDITSEETSEHKDDKKGTQDADAKVDNSKGGKEENKKPEPDNGDQNRGIDPNNVNTVIPHQDDEYYIKTHEEQPKKEEPGKPINKTGGNFGKNAAAGAATVTFIGGALYLVVNAIEKYKLPEKTLTKKKDNK